MAECVVHLYAGNPFAFLSLALLDSQLLLGLGADGSLGQRRHQLPPGPDDDAPRGQSQTAQRRDADTATQYDAGREGRMQSRTWKICRRHLQLRRAPG